MLFGNGCGGSSRIAVAVGRRYRALHLESVIDNIGMVAAAGGPIDDAAAFNDRVRLLWFGAGSGELREWGITQRRLAELDKAGIRYTYWETPDVAHEWLTWRRCLNEFVTLPFR